MLSENDLRHGDETTALHRLQEALALDPDFVRGWNAYAEVMLRSHRFPEAAIALRRALSLRPAHPLIHLNVARLYRLQNNTASAHRELNACAVALEGTPERDTYFPAITAEQNLLKNP